MVDFTREKLCYVVFLSAVTLGVGTASTCCSSGGCQLATGLPGRDGRDGVPGPPGPPGNDGTLSYTLYKDLKEKLFEELKREILETIEERCCEVGTVTVTPTMTAFTTPTSPLTTNPLTTANLPTTRHFSTAILPTTSANDRSTAILPTTPNLYTTFLPKSTDTTHSETVTDFSTPFPHTTNDLSKPISPTHTFPMSSSMLTTPSPTSDSGTIGDSEDSPAQSCHHVYQTNMSAPSGNYWINTTQGPTEVYCAMNPPNCNVTGGWMRVVLHDMTDSNTNCFGNTQEYTADGKRFCGPTHDNTCNPVTFPVHGRHYSHVCGRALGYSYYVPRGFSSTVHNLTSHYLIGLSITRGPLDNNTNHIWSYTAGYQEVNSFSFNCPCAGKPGSHPPSYIGNDYYCDSAVEANFQVRWYTENVLWDGQDCRSPGCCRDNRLPWFWRTLDSNTNDDITVRWCVDRTLSHNNFGTELLEIYVI